MAESRMNEIARELLRLSKANKLAWEQATIKENEYRVFFPDIGMSISNYYGGADYYRLALINDTGRVINHLEMSLADLESEPHESVGEIYDTLQEIYELAKSYVQDAGAAKALQYLKGA